jgi:hypothetical protein
MAQKKPEQIAAQCPQTPPTPAEAAHWGREIAAHYVARMSAYAVELANNRTRTFDRQTARNLFGAANALYVAAWSSKPNAVDVEDGRVWIWYAGLSEPLEFDAGSVAWGDTYIFRTAEHLAADGANPQTFDVVEHMRGAKVSR